MANPSREPISYTTQSAADALEDFAGQLLGEDDSAEDVEEPEEPEQEEPEDEEVDVEAQAEESADEAEPEDTVSLETLDDVAKALGVEIDDLMANLKMRIKVNGEEQLVSLSEAQKGNQLERDYRHKTAELAEQRRAIQAERETALQSLQNAAVEAGAAIQWAEQQIFAQVNDPKMAELRASNPAEWVARQQEAQSRLAQLQQVRNQAQQQYIAAMQQQQQKHAGDLQAYLAEQDNQLRSKVSDWSEARAQNVATFLKSRYGFNEQEVGGVIDHRLVLLALDAERGAKAETDVAKAVSKLKVAPKLQPPGKQKSALQVKARHVAGLKAHATKTGHLRDAAKVIEALL